MLSGNLFDSLTEVIQVAKNKDKKKPKQDKQKQQDTNDKNTTPDISAK